MTEDPQEIRPSIVATSLRKSFPTHSGALLRLWAGLPDTSEMREVLSGVNIVVPRGGLIGVLGQNGAGKSTLLRVLAGVYPPDGGNIAIEGEIASLFELGGLGNTQLSGRSFARGYFNLVGVPPETIERLVAEVLDFSELGRYFDQKISTYSSGMAARLYFAVATSIQREVYLIDEVLSVGDEHFQVKSQVRMRERLMNGASGVLVTHDWASVVRLCRHASILEKGKLSEPAPADEVIARYLNLVPPSSDVAYLVVKEEYRIAFGEPLAICFEVSAGTSERVEIAISIDALEPGVGWEPVVLTDFLPVSDKAGKYTVTLSLPFVPLRPGAYSLGFFLTSCADVIGERTALDARAWTYGNGVTLVVEGGARLDLAPFPINWSQVAT